MAQGGSVLDLIWAACLGSDGQGGLGCWAAALNAGVGFRGGGFARDIRSGAPGGHLGCGLVQQNEGDMCSPLRPRAGHGEALRDGGNCGGGSAP